MDLSFEGGTLDASKCSKLSMDEKRELVYQLSEWSGASEILHSWSRQEILQILCVEMGKERKYTGLTKLKIIEQLLKIVSKKKSGESEAATDLETGSSPASSQRTAKRQRKTDNPSRLPLVVNSHATNDGNGLGNAVYCKNSACKATLKQDDAFCRRCSCCICYRYDDNKDPSLWLFCSTEPQFQGVSCGLSCHLDCALKHESSGIQKDGCHGKLDGSFRCVACGKVNDLLGSWRKQLMIAKDTRRVDILCYRLSLSRKLLSGTEKYHTLNEIVDEAVRKLEGEIGTLTGLPVKMGRGIVNRLSVGPDVQKLCTLALESLDKLLSNNSSHSLADPIAQVLSSNIPIDVRFQDVCGTSLAVILGSKNPSSDVIVGYTLWHRKAREMIYPMQPTCTLFAPNTRFTIKGLSPSTEYMLKVVSFNNMRELDAHEVHFSTGSSSSTLDEVTNCSLVERTQSPATNCSTLSNPSSVEDETNNNTPCGDQIVNRANNYLGYCKNEKIDSMNTTDGATDIASTVGGITVDGVPLLDGEDAMQVVGSVPNSEMRNLGYEHSPECASVEEMSTDNGSDAPVQTGMECVPFAGISEASLPVTPCKLETLKDAHARSKSSNADLRNGIGKGEDDPQDGSTSKKRSEGTQDEGCTENGHSDKGFEYYVKVIRWLECEGHVEKNFRQKFLTWYSLRATAQEMRVVRTFVDTFIDDPATLAEQLVDTFSDCVSNRRSSVVPAGFCMKLWH